MTSEKQSLYFPEAMLSGNHGRGQRWQPPDLMDCPKGMEGGAKDHFNLAVADADGAGGDDEPIPVKSAKKRQRMMVSARFSIPVLILLTLHNGSDVTKTIAMP